MVAGADGVGGELGDVGMDHVSCGSVLGDSFAGAIQRLRDEVDAGRLPTALGERDGVRARAASRSRALPGPPCATSSRANRRGRVSVSACAALSHGVKPTAYAIE